MNLKKIGILTAFAVSVVMAQDAAPAAVAPVATTESAAPAEATAPVAETPVATAAVPAQEPAEVVPQAVTEVEPMAVRGADAAQPVQKKKKKFVYRPVYNPSEVEHLGRPVKAIYVSEPVVADTIDMNQLRGLVPIKFTFGLQGFIGAGYLSYDNGYYDYEYDSYSGLTWNVGAFALFPLDEYNMAFKAGVLFEHSKVRSSFEAYDKDKGGVSEWRTSFSQYRISIPLLLSLKAARSSIHLDIGIQPSIAVADKFKLKNSKDKSVGGTYDMMDNESREPLDWSIVLGLGFRVNRYVGFDARFNWGIDNMYDDFNEWRINDLTSKSFAIGATFYAF
jgi:hypothetical protein